MAAFFTAGAAAEELVAFKIVDDESIEESLTGKPGDPVRGREVAVNRKQGNCLACHKMPIPEQPFHGEIGPDLQGRRQPRRAVQHLPGRSPGADRLARRGQGSG